MLQKQRWRDDGGGVLKNTRGASVTDMDAESVTAQWGQKKCFRDV